MWGRYNVTVNTVAFGLIQTRLTQAPADTAGAVYLLCIPESDYVSAQTLICGGGFFG